MEFQLSRNLGIVCTCCGCHGVMHAININLVQVMLGNSNGEVLFSPY